MSAPAVSQSIGIDQEVVHIEVQLDLQSVYPSLASYFSSQAMKSWIPINAH